MGDTTDLSSDLTLTASNPPLILLHTVSSDLTLTASSLPPILPPLLLHPLPNLPPPHTLQHRKSPRPKNNTLIQLPPRPPRLGMPHPGTPFPRTLPGIPKASCQIPPLAPLSQIRLAEPVLQQSPTLARLAVRFEIQLVEPVLVDGRLELRVEGDEIEGCGWPGEV